MVFKNTKLCMILFMIAALIYLLNNKKLNQVDESTEVDDSNQENFDNALNNVIESYENTDDNTDDNSTNEEEVSSSDNVNLNNQTNVQGNELQNENHADFTSDGKNYYNNLTNFDSADLLPNPDNESNDDEGWKYKHGANWDESNPQIKQVEGNAWLNERKFLGTSTVGSSLRNATHDIRKDVPNPQMVVSPWNNTTILPDSNSKGLCSF